MGLYGWVSLCVSNPSPPPPAGSGGSPEGAGPEEGEGPVTPFDLGPELAEGHFDPQGHFLWHPAPPPDPWLEAIEGLPIKPRPPRRDVIASPPPSPPPSGSCWRRRWSCCGRGRRWGAPYGGWGAGPRGAEVEP
ncbi:CD2 antigen cytoplasmic tail-binding protein 2 [Pezoporus flaviventris]|uniref:CD2 antigen cytoplasmic tail-binding protein 2 n=1 Tax=Pezoporus flaviventris TaxID=889875 RepID=UPI002AB1EFF3|nr:CD2 antigen cytoplasmic tail-binding protein 2 [Pezoporus flaviventris]